MSLAMAEPKPPKSTASENRIFAKEYRIVKPFYEGQKLSIER